MYNSGIYYWKSARLFYQFPFLYTCTGKNSANKFLITKMDFLPSEVIDLLLLSLSLRDMLQLCSINKKFKSICEHENLWHIIAEREYNQYLSAFSLFIVENGYHKLVIYLNCRLIIDVYSRTLIVGKIIISPTDTVQHLTDAMEYAFTLFTKFPHRTPKTSDRLPIVEIDKIALLLADTNLNEIQLAGVLVKSNNIQISLRVGSLGRHRILLDANFNPFQLEITDRPLNTVYISELFTNVKWSQFGQIPNNITLFDSIKELYRTPYAGTMYKQSLRIPGE